MHNIQRIINSNILNKKLNLLLVTNMYNRLDTNPPIIQEKYAASLTSVIAAVFLTGFKLAVGIATGSLGILAEAAHSGLDLVAALLTLFAICLSDKPADKEHLYGHGKIENLSAMFEAFLLFITCGWIIYEAVHRLWFKTIHVDASPWAFIVMMLSMLVDFARFRVLNKTAQKYNSQALEADALHFKTDIWSSAVVVFGLLCVKISDLAPTYAFLHKADALSAIGVALIVAYISVSLCVRSVKALLDTAPAGLAEKITNKVQSLPGIVDCHHVRVRYSGPHLFVDVHVRMDGTKLLEDAHALTEVVEETIRKIIPDTDITVHPEPTQKQIKI